jgi:hypothetical protein
MNVHPGKGFLLDAVVHHELGHALVGIKLGIVIYGIELCPCEQGWGGLTLSQEDVPDSLVPSFMIQTAAGPEAMIRYCAEAGEQLPPDADATDRQQSGEILQYAAERGIEGVPTYAEALVRAREELGPLWPRLQSLAPILAKDKSMIRSELIG